MSKRVLIVAFTFPPTPGIGGRRWAKFAKYLKRNGHVVKVIAASNQESGISEWVNDYEEMKEDVRFIDSSYPKYLGIKPVYVSEKLRYRLSLVYAKIACKGNYYDKSNYWKNKLLKACREIIRKENINNLVCTIGPFRSSHYLLQLKQEFPQLNILVDYRDPWTNNKTSFGFTALSPKRFSYELMLEREVVQRADRLLAVSEEMGTYFKNFLPEGERVRKFKALPNGFDTEDFGSKPQLIQTTNSHTINIVFAGTFYTKSVHVFEKLIKSMLKLEEEFPEKKGFLSFTFIGSITDAINPYFEAYPHILKFLGKKSLQETYQIIAEADACALFLTDDLNYSFSTKFYEYLGMQKKIITFSKVKGNNAKFIEQNKLGFALCFDSIDDVLKDFYFSDKLQRQEKNPTFDREQYNVKNLTKTLETFLAD